MSAAAQAADGDEGEARAPDTVPLAVVAQFLVDADWPAEQLGHQPILRTAFQGTTAAWFCYAHCRPEWGQVLFYSVAPERVPEAQRAAVAEYLTRANWGLMIGNFELDYSDGEVRYKTSLQLDATMLTDDLLRPLIFGNVVVMDKYLPGLEAVRTGQQTPWAAIQAIEKK